MQRNYNTILFVRFMEVNELINWFTFGLSLFNDAAPVVWLCGESFACQPQGFGFSPFAWHDWFKPNNALGLVLVNGNWSKPFACVCSWMYVYEGDHRWPSETLCALVLPYILHLRLPLWLISSALDKHTRLQALQTRLSSFPRPAVHSDEV